MHSPRRLRITLLAACLALATTACTHAPPVAAPEQQPVAAPSDPESIGSLRNARVALPGAKSTTVTFLAGDLSPEQLAELQKIAPNLRVLHGLSRQQALEHAAEAQGIDARFASREFLEKAPNLVWVQAMSAGVEYLMNSAPLVKSERIVITNMRAVHGPAIADHAFAMLLLLTRNLREYEQNQARGRWSAGADDPALRQSPPLALQGRTMLVVGLGGIGTEIAQRAHGFGMKVTAIRRSDTPAPSYVEHVGHAGDLLTMLPEADVVAICLPLTPETSGLFNAQALAAMKRGSFLINIARGKLVDTTALVAALDSGHLAGACLDVTDPEPLPPDHPLWKCPNVVITPHVASDAELTEQRRWALLRENLRRFAAGEPLLNVVDKEAGY